MKGSFSLRSRLSDDRIGKEGARCKGMRLPGTRRSRSPGSASVSLRTGWPRRRRPGCSTVSWRNSWTGGRVGKREVEGLVRGGAADVDSFCQDRRPAPAPDDHALVLTFDGKGIVMRPDALRPATAKAAASARNKLATRLSPGEKNGRKRMAVMRNASLRP